MRRLASRRCTPTPWTATTCRCPTSAWCSTCPAGRRWPERLKAAGVRFVIEPHTRFEGQVGEQATMFFLDPAGNALEFKAFADMGQLFAS